MTEDFGAAVAHRHHRRVGVLDVVTGIGVIGPLVERLEVRPYARYTVDMQEIVDKEHGPNSLRRGIRSLFGLGTDEDDEDGDEDSVEEEKN